MDDLISRQAAIKEVREAYENDEMFDGYEYRLNELPSKEPEIIYCVGCKYMYTEETGFWCAQTGKEVRLDHYCGYADRKENTNEVNH